LFGGSLCAWATRIPELPGTISRSLQAGSLQTLPDGQFAHMRHAQIARRAIVPQWLNADLQKMS
jgi:hypothetical protein